MTVGQDFGFTIPELGINGALRPHGHHNGFWCDADDSDGRTRPVELQVRIPQARDWLCVGNRCGGAWAAAGTDMAELLGSLSGDDAVFSADHQPIPAVSLEIRK